MTLEEIGARLVIDPGAAIANLQELDDKLTQVYASLVKVGAAADASMAKIAKSAEASVVASAEAGTATAKAGDAAILASDAAVVGATSHGKAVDAVGTKTDALTKKTKTLTQSIADLGSTGVAKFGMTSLVGALGIAGESIDQYMKYQKAMTQLVTQAGLPANRLPAIMAGGLQIGKETGLNFNDIANQLYRIVSATSGLKETNKQILQLGKSAADIAVLFKVGPGAPTEQVARLFGSIANAARGNKLQQTGGSAAGIAALLNATVGTGDIRGQDLVGALGRGVLQSGEAAHAKLPDILSWIDLSTRLGAQPSTSGTLIAHAIQQLVGGSEQAKHAEAMVGVTPSEMANLVRTQGIGAAVADLYTKAQSWNPLSYYPAFGTNAAGAASAQAQANAWLLGTPQEMASFYNNTASPQVRQNIEDQLFAKMFGGARQEIPFLSIAENQGLYGAIENQIRAQSNAGTYNKDLKTALGTPQQQMEIALRNLQAYSIQLGQDITPYLLKFVHGVVDAASWLNSHRAVLDSLVAVFGSLAGLGATVWIGGKIAKTILEVQKFFTYLGTVGDKLGTKLGIGGGTSSTTAPLAANTEATDLNTTAIQELTAKMYANVFTGAPNANATNMLTQEGESTLGTEAVSTGLLSKLTTGLGSKVLAGGTYGLIASMLYNSFLAQPVTHLIGKAGSAALGDTATGAAIGTGILPGWGTLVGAGLGALYSQRKSIMGFLDSWFHSGKTPAPVPMPHGGPHAPPTNIPITLGGDIPGSTRPTLAQRNLGVANQNVLEQERLQHLNQLESAALSAKSTYGAGSSQYRTAYASYLATATKWASGIPGKMVTEGANVYGLGETAAQLHARLTGTAGGVTIHGPGGETVQSLSAAQKLLTSQKTGLGWLEAQKKEDTSLGVSKTEMKALNDQISSMKGTIKAEGGDVKNLTKAKDTLNQTNTLKTSLSDLQKSQRQVLQSIADAINKLTATGIKATITPAQIAIAVKSASAQKLSRT